MLQATLQKQTRDFLDNGMRSPSSGKRLSPSKGRGPREAGGGGRQNDGRTRAQMPEEELDWRKRADLRGEFGGGCGHSSTSDDDGELDHRSLHVEEVASPPRLAEEAARVPRFQNPAASLGHTAVTSTGQHQSAVGGLVPRYQNPAGV